VRSAGVPFQGDLTGLRPFWPNVSRLQSHRASRKEGVDTAELYVLLEGHLAPDSPKRHTCLDRELLVAMVILHILNGSHDTLLHITNIFKQPLHFKAVIERVASKFPSRVCTTVEKSTEMNKREAER
jgi:hypothetical protein